MPSACLRFRFEAFVFIYTNVRKGWQWGESGIIYGGNAVWCHGKYRLSEFLFLIGSFHHTALYSLLKRRLCLIWSLRAGHRGKRTIKGRGRYRRRIPRMNVTRYIIFPMVNVPCHSMFSRNVISEAKYNVHRGVLAMAVSLPPDRPIQACQMMP